MDTTTLAERLEIHDLVCRFMQAFDDKDWALLRACLADVVFCDYSSLRGTPPGEEEAAQYVARRQAALSSLRMQHDFSNLRVEVDGARARGRCNFVIHRFAPDFNGSAEQFFHTYGHYRFDFTREPSGWRIRGITQVVLQSHGNPALHSGASGARPPSKQP
jgi:hypothetical protein